MNEGQTAYLGLGSNLGQRLANLRRAVQRIDAVAGIRVDGVSPVYESEAHTKGPDDGLSDFLNLVVRVDTRLSPAALLEACLFVETAEGRQRARGSWLPRTIDIDILALADHAINSERLKVPHPRMAERRFVLLPFADLDPNFLVPEPFSATVRELLDNCGDTLHIHRRYLGNVVFSAGGRAT